MKRIACFLVLLLCGQVLGQIDVPSQVDVGQQLVATVKATVPDGATFDGGWSIVCKDGADCQATFAELKAPNSIAIWAPVGEYEVRYSGFWILLKEVKFRDGDGNEVVIQSYQGHGIVTESAGVVVGTPVPPPPPTPKGPWKIWYFEDPDKRENLTTSQQSLLASLKYREQLQREGHLFQEVVQPPSITSPPSRLTGVVAAYKAAGVSLPAVALSPLSGEPGAVRVYPLPADAAALDQLLANPPEVRK